MRSLTCARLRSLIFGAFSLAIPERMPAAPAGSSSIVNVMTYDNRNGESIIAAINPVVGGAGGMPTRDGTNGSGADAAYLKNTPVEINEAEVPIKILRYGLSTDSGGAGRWRGGLATELEFQVFSPATRVTVRNRDRCRFRPWGTLGGKAGKPSRMFLNPGCDNEVVLNNTDIFTVDPGDVVRIVSPGGGGRGCPTEREPERVLNDIVAGYVTQEGAERDYGVVVREGVVLAEKTAARRAEMRHFRQEGHFDLGPEREAFERVWSCEAYDALTALLADLPTHWRFFVKTKLFALVHEEGAGAEGVQRAYRKIVETYPQLAAARSGI
jgi:N-methylhydantoinase B